MRIEHHHRRLPIILFRDFPHAAQDVAMADMHAIEIADRKRARTERGRCFFEATEDAEISGQSGVLRHFEFEAVIGQTNVRRQTAFGLRVPQVVGNMREEGALRR